MNDKQNYSQKIVVEKYKVVEKAKKSTYLVEKVAAGEWKWKNCKSEKRAIKKIVSVQ